MRGNVVEALLGAVVLVVAAGFLVFAYSSTDLAAVEGYQVHAKFDRIDGLIVGGDVRLGISGQPAGWCRPDAGRYA